MSDTSIVLCLDNGGGVYGDLFVLKLYTSLRDAKARAIGMVRVIDESGESYLYPSSWFAPTRLTPEIRGKVEGCQERYFREPRPGESA